MTDGATLLHNLPSADDYARAARRRAARFGAGGLALAVAVALSFVGLGMDNALLPVTLLIALATPVLLWRFPQLTLYALFGAACLIETGASGYADALTDRVPFFWNINTIFQQYAHADVKAVPLSLMEVFVLVAGVCSALRTVYTRTASLRAGGLAVPIALYMAFVGLGWVNGILTGGDFKISLQEVRSQFYFGLAYLMAFNMVREPRQLGVLLRIFVACVGLKGILLTFRRYVTLHGLPLPDQGVGAHEEAFFFDAFIVLLLVLTLCKTHRRLRWAMWALLPFVELGNLACNRRAAVAAMVVVVPLLLAAAARAFPERRKAIALFSVTMLAFFSVYYPAFRNSGSLLAQPARAIQSQFAPDARDAASNAYRVAEDGDLYATIKLAPVQGYGYGKRMLHALPIVDISKDYEWWDIMTHDQILWVWMRVGTLGFVAFWLMVSAILIRACLLVRDAGADGEARTVGLFTLLVTGMLMMFGLLDLQLSNFRDMLFAGFWTGALATFPLTGIAEEALPARRQPPSPQFWGNRRRDADSPIIGGGGASDPRPELGEGRPSEGGVRASGGTHKVARNVATTLATQLLSWGLTFVVTLYLPRYIGDVGLGAFTLAGSFAVVMSLMVSLGTSTVLVKDIARDHARTGEWVWAALALRVPLGLLAVALGWGVSHLLNYDAHLRVLILVGLGVMALAQIGDVLASALRGLEEIPRQNAAALAEKVVTGALTISLVMARAPLWMIVAAAGAGACASLVMNALGLRGHLGRVKLPNRDALTALARAGLPFLTTAVFVAVYGQADALLLSKMSTVAAIGWYGLAKRLGGTTMVIPVALTGAMLPTLSRLYHEDEGAFQSAVRRLFNLMLVSVVPFAALLVFAPARILALLHYPASFAHSIPVLMLMGGAVVLWFLSQVAGTALIACDRQGVVSRVAGVAALASVPLCAACIFATQRAWGNGAVGAMLSDVLLEVYMVAAYVRALPPGMLAWGSMGVLGRAIVGALPLVGLFALAQGRWGVLMLVPGLLAYVPLCAVLGCLHPADVQMARQFVTRFAGRRAAA